MIACPDCGARNTDDAPWCTQCLRPFGETAVPTPAPPSDPPPEPAPVPDVPPASAGEDRAVRSVDGGFEWRCPACDSWNDLEQPACAVCGHALGSAVTGGGSEQAGARVGRVRRILWVAAGIGAVLMAVAVVLLVLALRSGGAG